MLKPTILLFFSFLSSIAAPAQNFNVEQESQGDSIIYYASSTSYCPYNISLQPEIDTIPFGNPHFFVLEARSKRKRILAYPRPTQAGKVTFETNAYFGNPALIPDSSYIYSLPYTPKTRHFIMQGYNGRFSHKNQYALDFKMPIGTPIHAARGGIVIKVKQDSDKHGRTAAFAPHGNHIIIYHTDGTMAYYYHLSQNSSRVQVGDTIQQKQFIALSGNTGWSTAPHLHFIIKSPLKGGYGSLPTWFCTSKKPQKRLKSMRKHRACE